MVPAWLRRMVSRSQADKAGERIRRALTGQGSADEFDDHYAIVSHWRMLHDEPLEGVTAMLRHVVRTTCLLPAHDHVFARLKREDQIIAKLLRERTRLSSMTDIAGCRAVLPVQAQVIRVYDSLLSETQALEVVRVRDYVREERHHTGDRAIHILGRLDGRRVEIQLRTELWHDWAMGIENYDSDTGEDAKHGRAKLQPLEYFERLADRLVTLENLADAEEDA